MFKIILPLASLAAGAIIGSILTVNASLGIAKYLSIAIMAALDSVLGGARALLEDTFDSLIMLSGFFTNALLAMALAYLGDQIGIDMFMAATICFALRIFANLAYIRRDLLTRYREHSKQSAPAAKTRIRFVSNKRSQPQPDPNLENTISGLLLDAIPLEDTRELTRELTDEEIDQTPVKVKAMVSNPDKTRPYNETADAPNDAAGDTPKAAEKTAE